MEVLEILRAMGIDEENGALEVSRFKNVEDGSDYAVWKVQTAQKVYVLKKAKGQELSVYAAFFDREICGAPRFCGSTQIGAEDYFLMEYVPGEDLRVCSREKLVAVLDALISLQALYWEDRQRDRAGLSFEESLKDRKNRGNYLKDPELEAAYAVFLAQYRMLPRTLCHDDLLPFNVLISEGKATIIDWEQAGILPYPTSLARLIAHGEEKEGAFFYMKEEDRAFAVEYYYENLVKKQNISYADYRRALDACLLYEYCEWIMLGNRYADADMERYRYYCEKARAHVQAMKNR